MPPGKKEKEKQQAVSQNTGQATPKKRDTKTKPAAPPSAEKTKAAVPSAAPKKTAEEKKQEKERLKEEKRKLKEEQQKAREEKRQARINEKAKAANEKMMRMEAEKKAKEKEEEEKRRARINEKAKAANEKMMRMEADKKQEEAAAERAHTRMANRANDAQRTEYEQKKKEYKKEEPEYTEKLSSIIEKGDELKKSKISHTQAARDELQNQKKRLETVEEWFQRTGSATVLFQDPKLERDFEGLKNKKKNAQDSIAAAEEKITKYSEYRAEYDTEAQNERLLKFISKIATQARSNASGANVANASGANVANASGAAAATQTPTANQGTEDPQTMGEKIEEFYGDNAEVFVDASDNIQKIIHTSFDIAGELKGAAETSSSVFKGFFSFFGAIKAGFSAWNTFSRMYKRDNTRSIRPMEKDSADRWQDARLGMEKIADVLTGVLGAVGSVIGTGPGAILGIISNCIVLFMKFVSIADSSARIHGINNRKSKLWNELEEKRKKYAAEYAGEEEPGAEVDAYNMHGLTRASAIKKKREQLRNMLSNSMEYKMESSEEMIATRFSMPVGEKHFMIRQHFGDAYTSLSDKIVQEQAWAKNQNLEADLEKKKKYKTRIRLMKALELIERYYEEDQAQNRQIKLLSHSIEDSIVESADMVGNLADLSVVGAGAGKIINVAAASYKLIRGAGSKIHGAVSNRIGHANDKKFVRDEMAKTMYQSIQGMLTKEYGWDGYRFDGNNVENFRMKSAAGRLKHVRGMITGLDLHMDPLMQASDKAAFIDSLSSAFSQDGNG